MTDETGASAGGEAVAADLPADAPEEFSSVHDAAAYFNGLQEKRKNPPAESAEPATAEHESPVEGDAAADENQPTGETEEVDPAEKPPLELPRSWTKEQAEHWKALPRETQEYLTERASKDSEAIRKVQNEAAEKLKGLTAKEQQVEQVRQQSEATNAALLQALHDTLANQFADIQSEADIDRMANEDPFRKLQWDRHQEKMRTALWRKEQADNRLAQERQSKRAALEAEQNKLLIELVPDMADPKKAAEKRERAVAMLNDDLGLKTETLQRWMQDDIGHEILSNAGIQKLIADRLELKDIRTATKAVSAKTLPPVQRPGASKPLGQNANSERIQALNRKPELTIKEATELVTLQQPSQRRAS